MSDQSKPEIGRRMFHDSSSSRQAVKFLTAATIGSTFLVSSGLTLTGTVLILILSTPILVLLSPILFPAATLLVLAAAGFLFSTTCAAAAVAALWWMYRYLTGNQPPGAEELEYAMGQIAEMARGMKDRAKEYGRNVKSKAEEMMTTTATTTEEEWS